MRASLCLSRFLRCHALIEAAAKVNDATSLEENTASGSGSGKAYCGRTDLSMKADVFIKLIHFSNLLAFLCVNYCCYCPLLHRKAMCAALFVIMFSNGKIEPTWIEMDQREVISAANSLIMPSCSSGNTPSVLTFCNQTSDDV